MHGFVWPQLASEWSTLTEAERMAGTEAICSEGKKLRPAIVIGAQALSNEGTGANNVCLDVRR